MVALHLQQVRTNEHMLSCNGNLYDFFSLRMRKCCLPRVCAVCFHKILQNIARFYSCLLCFRLAKYLKSFKLVCYHERKCEDIVG